MNLRPYFIFNGQCEEALNMYAPGPNGRILHLSCYGINWKFNYDKPKG